MLHVSVITGHPQALSTWHLKLKIKCVYIYIYTYFCGAAAQSGTTTSGKTPLDEWSARRRHLYLTTHNTHNRQTSTPPTPIIPSCERIGAYMYNEDVIFEVSWFFHETQFGKYCTRPILYCPLTSRFVITANTVWTDSQHAELCTDVRSAGKCRISIHRTPFRCRSWVHQTGLCTTAPAGLIYWIPVMSSCCNSLHSTRQLRPPHTSPFHWVTTDHFTCQYEQKHDDSNMGIRPVKMVT
jgi:hypothetical protein